MLEIDDLAPIVPIHHHHRHLVHLHGLHECQNLEQFIESTEAAGKYYQRVGPHREVKLAHGKIVKLEGQFRCAIGVWLLLPRQPNIKSDAGSADFHRAAICGLHDSWTTASGDNVVAYIAVWVECAT